MKTTNDQAQLIHLNISDRNCVKQIFSCDVWDTLGGISVSIYRSPWPLVSCIHTNATLSLTRHCYLVPKLDLGLEIKAQTFMKDVAKRKLILASKTTQALFPPQNCVCLPFCGKIFKILVFLAA